MSAPNIIPFARPRAIAAMPATFTAVRPGGAPPPTPAPSPPVPRAVPAVGSSPMPSGPPAPAPVSPTAPTVPVELPLATPPAMNDAVPAVAPSRWAAFEKLGLRPPALDGQKLSKHIVSAYRLLGFAILTIIVIVLVGYIATTAFFYMSDSWIVPMALTSTDEKVVALQGQLAEAQNARDRTSADLADAERAITVQQQFQDEFEKAIRSDLAGRKAALARMHELATEAAATRRHIRASNTAYAQASQRRMAREYAAGLIDRHDLLNGKFQIAQIDNSNLSLSERQAEYETRAADLEAQTRSLEALLANTTSTEPLSYDVLKIKQEYEASRLETQKAIENRDTLKAALARQDKLVHALEQSAYLRAIADHAQVAFVPYGNLHDVAKGKPLYACRLGMIFCHEVGTVLEVLPGEVQFKHPNRDKQLRGQMVELQLEDGAAATDDVLFVGGRPLLI